jgi:hypothetical protein
MKTNDWFILGAIVGGLVLMFFFTRHTQPERVKPGTAEYEAYIERFVAECLRNQPPGEPDKSGLPASSDAERVAACRASVLQADRLYPDGRPLRQQQRREPE